MRLSILLLAWFTLAGCEEPQTAEAPPVRAIKSMIVSKSPATQTRRIAGVTDADLVTDLSFEVPGKLLSLPVSVGDEIDQGSLIARLDATPYELKRQNARQKFMEVEAQLIDAQATFERMQAVLEGGFVSQAEFDSAKTNVERLEASVAAASTQLALADRDLANTALLAPFSGKITAIHVDQFNDLAAGQRIVQLTASGSMNVDVLLPENLINQIGAGDVVQVTLPGIPNKPFGGTVAEINTTATETNAFEVTVALEGDTSEVRPGMSAEVVFSYHTEREQTAFILPTSAVVPSASESGTATIYVYDESMSVVKARQVTIVGIIDNTIEVIGDIAQGDRVATAGVTFLVDGMKVKLMNQTGE